MAWRLWQTLTFDEFVDLFSVFSSRAPKDEKIKVAFRMYDFDDNGFIVQRNRDTGIERPVRPAPWLGHGYIPERYKGSAQAGKQVCTT